jgi:hypothetical protein
MKKAISGADEHMEGRRRGMRTSGWTGGRQKHTLVLVASRATWSAAVAGR